MEDNMIKKISLCLLFSFLLSFNSYAFSDIYNETESSVINKLVNFGIINGYTDGTFKPENNITRAEFSKLIIFATGYNYTEYEISDDFIDVTDSHWAKDYIYISKKLGIVNGTSDTTFEPEGNITYEEAIKMIVCALGCSNEANIQGGYPDGYISVAKNLNITDDILFIQTDTATRINIVKMINNMLNTEYYYFYENNGDIIMEKSVLTLEQIHNMRLRNMDEETEY